MTDPTIQTSPRLRARIAGVLYIIIMALALFGPFPVAPSGLARADAATTVDKIIASKSMYSLGGAAELIVYTCDIGVALIFYGLLAPVNRNLSLLALLLRIIYVAVAIANVLNHFAVLLVLSGNHYLTAFQPDQLRAAAAAFVRLHTVGFDIALVFFGLHCLVAGYLFSRSNFFPRILGILLAIAGVAYLMNSYASFVSPSRAAELFRYTLPFGVGEVLLPIWLVTMGVNSQRWTEQARALEPQK
ncbi:MAG: DUF4386 domain-containing protein [Acidobacteria bacterium]|nr:DUF4386 domain-containing protein [Acidobacteriota bacterium]